VRPPSGVCAGPRATLAHPFGSALRRTCRWGDMRPRRNRAPTSPGRAALQPFDVFEILEKAPHCVIVIDKQAAVVYQNTASRELDERTRVTHSEALLDAVRVVLQDSGAGRRYPLTVPVSATTRSGQVHADVTVDRIAGGFVVSWSDRTQTRECSQVVTKVATELLTTAESFTAFADLLANAVSEVSEQAYAVATGSDQLTDSIQEIASSASTAVGNTAGAVRSAQSATDLVARLSESSDRIGAVSRLIGSIAGQTNLLALNATIEAARAGQAGRGFAVVASEVKTLARRSAEATEDITSTVAAIQADTAAAAAALEQIVHAIEMMDSEQTTIATAVEEQSMTAAEIGARVAAVARAAESSSSALTGLREAAAVVAAKSHELRALV
jgi:Methyl-accepting chemotaxis protein (MCP) signalling domain